MLSILSLSTQEKYNNGSVKYEYTENQTQSEIVVNTKFPMF